MEIKPRYPIYIPSKGRPNSPTARCFMKYGVDFRIGVEPQDEEAYRKNFGDKVLVLPFSNLGKGSIPSRNFGREWSESLGAKRHWDIDDNICNFYRWFNSHRDRVSPAIALSACEDFTDAYSNIAISGLEYAMFATPTSKFVPYALNTKVYSCTLVNNELPFKWRGRYNEDTDLCLQALTAGYCTVLIKQFLSDKMATMTMKGGNSDELYKNDGRLKMAQELQRNWQQFVTIKHRFKRPQHVVNWKIFKTQLILKPDTERPMQRVNDLTLCDR